MKFRVICYKSNRKLIQKFRVFFLFFFFHADSTYFFVFSFSPWKESSQSNGPQSAGKATPGSHDNCIFASSTTVSVGLVPRSLSQFAKDFPGGSDGKVSAYNTGNPGSIPGSEGSPGAGNGNPLQYSCLANPMDGGAWQATVHGVAKSQTRLSDFTFTSLCPLRL